MATPSPYQKALQLDRGPAVLISSWVLISLSAVFVVARGAARKKLTKLESGDILLPLALILGFIQTTCVQLATDNGLGRSYEIQSPQAMDRYYETMYWAQILYIIILGITKTTIVLLVIPLGPPKPLLYACYLIGAEIVLSTIAFAFATAFQCDTPRPWVVNHHQCVDIPALGRAISITTIVTDILAICLPILAMILLNLNQGSRIFICSLLSSRLLVPAFVVVQLVYLFKYDTSRDPTYDAALVQIWTQTVLNVSIITACIPPLGCILSDIALRMVGRRVVPDTIAWGRYSPPGISRIRMSYEDQAFQPLPTPDKEPLCPGALATVHEQTTVSEKGKSSLSWFKMNPSSKDINSIPDMGNFGPNTKQVHFEDIPPIPETPPSNRYPETEIRSATLDVLADYTYNVHPGQFENPTMPPPHPPVPAIPAGKPSALHRRLSNALLHKRSNSVASTVSTKISEPSFVCASTLVTPPSSSTGGYRESFMFHRPTQSSGSIPRPTSSIYSKRESFLRTHRLSKSMSSFPSRQSQSYNIRNSTAWPGWFTRWENKIEEETSSPLGSGSFVDVDREFERCRNMYGQGQGQGQKVRVREI